MSHISPQGEQSTASEIAALTNLASLAISGVGQAIVKTGPGTFANMTIIAQIQPGGANGQIQFNDGGVMNGTPGLSYDKALSLITVSGLTLNSILFASTGGQISQDNSNFWWNPASKDLIIDGSSLNSNLNSSGFSGSLFFDGTTAGTVVSHPLRQPDIASASYIALGTDDFSLWVRFMCPTAAPSGLSFGIAGVSDVATSVLRANGFSLYIPNGSTSLRFDLFGSATGNFNRKTITSFIDNFGNRVVDVLVVRSTSNNTVTIYINGVLQTPTETTGGTPPTWAGSITSQYMNIGVHAATDLFNNRIYGATLFNRALSSTDANTIREIGVLYSDQWGNTTAKFNSSSNLDFETDAPGVTPPTAWTASGNHVATVVTDSGGGGSVACEIVASAAGSATAGTNNIQRGHPGLVMNKRYRFSFWAKSISGGTTVSAATGGGTLPVAATFTITASWQKFTYDFVSASSGSGTFRLALTDAAGTFRVDTFSFYEIGAVVDTDLDTSDPTITAQVRDQSNNAFTGTATGGATQTDPFKALIAEVIRLKPGNTPKSGASGTSGVGWLDVQAGTYTDASTAGSGTAAAFAFTSFGTPTLAAGNTVVTTTDAATLYIAAQPTAGTNMTITRKWAMWIDAGDARFDGNVYISTTAGAASNGLDANVSFGAAIVTKTSTYTATANDFTILCDATGGAITINLPAASGCARRIYNIKKIDSSGNGVTIDGNASETIDGSTTKSTTTQYTNFQIQCDGSNWYIL